MQFKEAKEILKRLSKSGTIEGLVNTISSLREARERYDAAMMMAIFVVENTHMQLLQDNGCDNIESFIRSYELCSTPRYRSFCTGLEAIGEEKAFSIGAEATIEAGRIARSVDVSEFVAATQAWSQEHGGVTPSKLTAEKLRLQIAPEKKTPGPLRRLTENAQLRARVHSLEVENKQLLAKVRKLERELLKSQPVAAE